MRLGTVIAALLTMFALPAIARAGVVIQLEQPGGRTTYSAQGKKLRIENAGEQGRIMIFDGDAQKLFELDPQQHQYTVTTQADAKGVSAQLEEALSKLPPEQRAKAEAMMKQRSAETEKLSHVTYEPTGGRETVAGYACQDYRVVREGKVAEEGCFIPWSSGTVTKDDLGALVEFGNFMEKFMAAVMGGQRGATGRIGDQIARAPGFPALMQRVEPDGKKERTEWLVSIKHTSVPSETFVVPAGYTKVEKPGLGRLAPSRGDKR